MREVFEGFLCDLDSCCKELIDGNTPCSDCPHCIDSVLYAVAEAEAMGADAIVNIRYASAAVMQGAAEVIAYGTAVKFVNP